MEYIIFDLEFNQDFSSLADLNLKHNYPFEIIQIGAIKFDSTFQTVSTFNRFVKPSIYTNISQFVTELTGITTQQLQTEETFPGVYEAYTEFIGTPESIFCIWGIADMKELFRNAEYHQLNNKLLPRKFINLQPYVSVYFGLSPNKLLRLKDTVEALNLPITYNFHNALHDAYYTAEIFKKIYNSFMHPKFYETNHGKRPPRQQKKEINYDKLLSQFEKMYQRNMTNEEQEIIKLAYKMGKTQQFLK